MNWRFIASTVATGLMFIPAIAISDYMQDRFVGPACEKRCHEMNAQFSAIESPLGRRKGVHCSCEFTNSKTGINAKSHTERGLLFAESPFLEGMIILLILMGPTLVLAIPVLLLINWIVPEKKS